MNKPDVLSDEELLRKIRWWLIEASAGYVDGEDATKAAEGLYAIFTIRIQQAKAEVAREIFEEMVSIPQIQISGGEEMNKQEAKTWEETVMSDDDLMGNYYDKATFFESLNGESIAGLREVARVQAKLTWEAGEKAGIQKVMEFLKGHRHQELLVGAHRFVFTENEWQAFLKDLGV